MPDPTELAATLRRLARSTTPGEWVLISHQEAEAIATALEQGEVVTAGIATALERGAAAERVIDEILALGSDLRLELRGGVQGSLRDDPATAAALAAHDALEAR
jgi:hypothetical protein